MQLQRNPDMEPTIDELVRDYMGATPPLPPQPTDAVVAPAQPQVIEPIVRQSSGVVRPVDLPPSGGQQ